LAARLAEFLSQAAARGFRVGEHDCMLFVADWARALTGWDPAAPWRGHYTDKAGADAIVAAAGGPKLLLDAALIPCGWGVAGIKVRAGDIVLAALHNEWLAGIVTAAGDVALLTRHGIVTGAAHVMYAWRHPAAQEAADG
jgi:hypothetical protein